MKANCRSRPVDADAAIVFAHLLLVPRYERWLMGCTSSVLEGGDEAAEGSRYRLAFGIGSFTDGESLVLREVDRTGHRLRLVKERAGPPLTIQVGTDGTGASCRLVVELEHSWTGRVLGLSVGGSLFRRMLTALLDQSVTRLERDLRCALTTASDDGVDGVT